MKYIYIYTYTLVKYTTIYRIYEWNKSHTRNTYRWIREFQLSLPWWSYLEREQQTRQTGFPSSEAPSTEKSSETNHLKYPTDLGGGMEYHLAPNRIMGGPGEILKMLPTGNRVEFSQLVFWFYWWWIRRIYTLCYSEYEYGKHIICIFRAYGCLYKWYKMIQALAGIIKFVNG